jgi:hypothetical protein
MQSCWISIIIQSDLVTSVRIKTEWKTWCIIIDPDVLCFCQLTEKTNEDDGHKRFHANAFWNLKVELPGTPDYPGKTGYFL